MFNNPLTKEEAYAEKLYHQAMEGGINFIEVPTSSTGLVEALEIYLTNCADRHYEVEVKDGRIVFSLGT